MVRFSVIYDQGTTFFARYLFNLLLDNYGLGDGGLGNANWGMRGDGYPACLG